MKVDIQAATTVCRALKKSEMLSRKLSKMQHELTIDCMIGIHPFCCCFSPQNGKFYGFTCKEQELLLSTWSLPGEVDRGRAGGPE